MKRRRSLIVWFFAGVMASAGWLAWSRPKVVAPPAGDRSDGGDPIVAKLQDEAPPDHQQRSASALSMSDPDERRRQLSEALAIWAETDAAAAVDWAESNVAEDDLPHVLLDALAAWIDQDTDAMLQWYLDGLGEHRIHRIPVDCTESYVFGEQVVAWLALLDPVRAASFLSHDLYRDGPGFLLYSEPGRDISCALRTANDFRAACEAMLPAFEKHGSHLGEIHEIVARWREIDPDGARQFSEQYPEAPRNPVRKAARAMETSEPKDAVASADRLIEEIGDDHEKLEGALHSIVNAWPEDELAEGITWVERQGVSEETAQARSALAVRLLKTDAATAFELLEPIPEGKRLEQGIERLVEAWASNSLEATLTFLQENASSWPIERITRLRELALTAR